MKSKPPALPPEPLVPKAKIQRVCRNANGPLFQTLFVQKGSDLAAPTWTASADDAAVLDWQIADRAAPKLGAHAVVVAAASLSAVENARPVRGRTREERLANYQAEMERRRWA